MRWKIRCVSTTSKVPAGPVWFAIYFPVILSELTFSYQHPSWQRAAAASRLSSQGVKFKQSNLNNKYSKIQNTGSTYQISDLNILSSTYSAMLV